MTDYVIRSEDGSDHTVSSNALDNLSTRLRGSLIRRETPGYDDARRIWNGMIDKRPAVIVRCLGTSDVVACINFVREHGLMFSIRSGGHNIAGTALCEGGVTIDLSLMKGIRVDPVTRHVWAQPGNNLGDLDHATQLHGLVVPGGIISATGIAGYTLGGGFGWLTRKWGYTCDLLRSVEMVTWQGQVITATAQQHADLFWGLSGGGGNFGIVTGFEFEAVSLGPTVMAGLVFHPMDQADSVIDLYRQVTESAPDELTCLLITRLAPPLPFIPPDMHGKPVVGIALLYAGSVEDAYQHVQVIKDFGSPVVDTIAPKPFIAHQSFLDVGQPNGRGYYWKSDYIDDFQDGLKQVTIDRSAHFSSAMSAVLVMHLGGAASRVAHGATAVAHHDAGYIYVIQASWDASGNPDEHISWAREYFADILPYSSGGTYVNFLNADDGDDRTRQAYDPDVYDRLVDIKNFYDPENHFRQNKNIRPDSDKATATMQRTQGVSA
jgi:FAD/FMN-containing dehydrogenase